MPVITRRCAKYVGRVAPLASQRCHCHKAQTQRATADVIGKIQKQRLGGEGKTTDLQPGMEKKKHKNLAESRDFC